MFLMYEPDQEAQPRQREPAAGDRRGAAHLRDARHPHRGHRPARRRGLPRPRRGVEFRDVTFATTTANGGTILDGVSFRVAPGEIVAIVGLSGAGKTTLVNLIPRFYDVTGGAILVDGVDIRDVTLASLRAQIGLVTQETVLFDDTIAAQHRLRSARRHAAEIEAAARAAHAHEFIAMLPERYETRIGERGSGCRGGQRQRLAIARALLKDPPILILDEATSSLDAESEQLVQDALAAVMRNRTSFVIAHRLSTVRRADAIVVLERGRIVETGRHDELLARPGGVYAGSTRCRCSAMAPDRRRRCPRPVPARARAPASRDGTTMIVSMTGFAAVTRESDDLAVNVTLRSVNHRFLDVQVRIPQSVQGLETALRSVIQQRLARGRVEVAMDVQERIEPVTVVELDEVLLQAVGDAVDKARAKGLVAGPLHAGGRAADPAGAQGARGTTCRRCGPTPGGRADRAGRGPGRARRDASEGRAVPGHRPR